MTAIWRTLHGIHAVPRAAFGLALILVAIAWLQRNPQSADPMMTAAYSCIGWAGFIAGLYLSLPGLWVMFQWLRKGSGPPRSVAEQNAHGVAKDATSGRIREALDRKSSPSSRPKFLD
jgi:hypothetical protein